MYPITSQSNEPTNQPQTKLNQPQAVQAAISEKTGLFLQHMSTFTAGYIISFVRGWVGGLYLDAAWRLRVLGWVLRGLLVWVEAGVLRGERADRLINLTLLRL
jgi:hypothetical protein